MQVTDVLARGAAAPIRLGLSLGGAGLAVARAVAGEARTVVGEAGTAVRAARRAVAGGESDRSAGWTRPRPPRVWSPAPGIRRRVGGRRSDDSPPMASLDIAEPPAAAPETASPPVQPAAAEGPAVAAVPPRGAKTVDDEPVTVAESAERGAEDGAGAQVHVDPPWDGYDALTAADVRDRLAAADASLAAAVALYEGAHRGRVSVVRAAERRLAALGA